MLTFFNAGCCSGREDEVCTGSEGEKANGLDRTNVLFRNISYLFSGCEMICGTAYKG
jgi:hypothetical protein